MRVAVQHLNELKKIAVLDTPERRELYKTGQFPRADKVKDLNIRYRWDLLYGAKRDNILQNGIIDEIYKYANDNHMDTALRSIVPSL